MISLSLKHAEASFLDQLADLARPVVTSYFRAPLDIECKVDESPVTQADRHIEQLIRDAVTSSFPQDGILGEEHGRQKGNSDYVWVIDPIDGTKAFISGMPTFGILVARVERGIPILGMIDIPILGERWLGAKGYQTIANGDPCNTRQDVSLADAVLYATSPDMFRGAAAEKFEAISKKVGMRRFGGDCYAYALLASGHIDLVIEANLKPYDYLAMVPIIEGAGGCISDWSGRPLGFDSDGCVLASGSSTLHQAALSALKV